MSIKIAPSLLSADFSRLGEEVEKVQEGGADLIHWDIMDGHFVPNITFGPGFVKALRNRTVLPFDVHLMIENPDDFVEDFARAGGDLISVHAEACARLAHTISKIKKLGVRAGVALSPATPLNAVEPILGEIDFLLVMTVNPGLEGQKFIPSVLAKIRRARELIDKLGSDIELEVDGGINEKTVSSVVKAGANILVAGHSVYSRDAKQAIRSLREKAEKV